MSDIEITAEMWMALVKRVQTLEADALPNNRLGPQKSDPEAWAATASKIVASLDACRFTLDPEPSKMNDVPPTDLSARVLADGSPIPEDGSHREINPATGQQEAYVVLSSDERSKGFARPYRDAYRHLKCGKITTMRRAIAETYARCPEFYSGTFCTTCSGHFPVGEDGEFVWYEMDGTTGPKVGT